jgi:hypothetical protein
MTSTRGIGSSQKKRRGGRYERKPGVRNLMLSKDKYSGTWDDGQYSGCLLACNILQALTF